MRITFDDPSRSIDRTANEYGRNRTAKTERAAGCAADISGVEMSGMLTDTYGLQGKTAEDIMRDASNQDVEQNRDYLTVMSSCMSDEDFARLQKEGYSPTDTDIETMVTIVDKIKAELARAGVEVVGYTDTLDMDTLKAITGSEGYARAIEEAFRRADVPLTRQNAADAVNAMRKAEELSAPTEGTERYMVDNGLEPTIDHFYAAEFSGADRGDRQARGYYRDDASGYYARRAQQIDMEEIRSQVEQVIARAGMEVNEDTLKDAEFLLQRGVPLTEDNLQLLGRIRAVQLPAEEEEIWKAAASALADGKPAGAANLYDGRSVFEKAADLERNVDTLLQEAEKSGNVTGYRQLQEIRLMMTAEVNVKLVRSGFSIDTADLEKLVEALKDLEQKQAESLFGAQENASAQYSLYKETVEKTAALPAMPADVVGRIAEKLSETTVAQVYDEGAALQKAYQEAEKSYEALMTAPRRDMGDSIKTAFRNVDDILEDMGLSLTEENRRAVRILGYNGMEITQEHLEAVKAADRTLQRVVDKMTPAAVVKMIRDGVNPLETGMEQLEAYLDGQEGYEEEAVRYSRYLYDLEQNKAITPEEKEAYIGIYRMLRQIEKTDGASVGRLVESGAAVSFANLLTAVRSGKAKGLDVAVDDQFGLLERLNARGVSITEQIAAGYTDGLTEFWSKEFSQGRYEQELLRDVRQAGHASQEDVAFLKELELPVTVDHLLAVSALRQDRGSMFRKLWEKREQLQETPEAVSRMDHWEDLLTDADSAPEAYEKYMEQLAGAAQELTFGTEESYMDVRAMQLIHKQISVAGHAARAEEYDIPAEIDGEMTAIHLTIRHEETSVGNVSVTVNTGAYGRITASLTLRQQKAAGFVTIEQENAGEKLRGLPERLQESLRAAGISAEEIPILKGGSAVSKNDTGTEGREPLRTDRGMRNTAETAGKESTGELYRMAKIFIRALKQNMK